MRKNVSRLTEALLLAMLLMTGVAITGCEEGPLEETGEELDDTADEIEDGID